MRGDEPRCATAKSTRRRPQPPAKRARRPPSGPCGAGLITVAGCPGGLSASNPAQLVGHVARTLPTRVGILRETLADQRIQIGRYRSAGRLESGSGSRLESRLSDSPASPRGRHASRWPSRTAPRQTQMSVRASPDAPSSFRRHVWQRTETASWRREQISRRGLCQTVAPAGCNLANPKSSSLTPPFVNMMFPGVRSRWTMPWQ